MSLKHVILGLLHEGPLTGYDIRHRITAAGLWSADQAQIYRTLASLTKIKLVTRHTVVQTDRPSQHPHEITAAGRAELRSWLASPAEVPTGPRDPFDLRVWFGSLCPPANTRQTLAERRADLQAVEEELTSERWERGTDLGSALRYAARARRLAHIRTEITWLDATDDLLARFDSDAGDATRADDDTPALKDASA
ncbi:PadR family transcriptional regulator [Granulicoccus sp. GXG6511]|uniref:PadR family transcriptional regulator n=1 Tax=Granulicoccus sp. GXG6511 TaxID=3381351 RepID=UPI003D7D3F4D